MERKKIERNLLFQDVKNIKTKNRERSHIFEKSQMRKFEKRFDNPGLYIEFHANNLGNIFEKVLVGISTS